MIDYKKEMELILKPIENSELCDLVNLVIVTSKMLNYQFLLISNGFLFNNETKQYRLFIYRNKIVLSSLTATLKGHKYDYIKEGFKTQEKKDLIKSLLESL